MIKKSAKVIGWFSLILILLILVSGCGATKPTTAKNDLTPNQAAELVYHDLTYHGIEVVKVNISNLTFKNANSASVDATFITADGRNISEKIALIKENGKWTIPDHNH